MLRLFAIFSFLVTQIPFASAIQFAIVAPGARKIVELQMPAGYAGRSVWEATVAGLRTGSNLKGINFDVERGYVRSINDLGEKVVKINSNETRYYGWCFSVNGKLPADGSRYLGANEVLIRSDADKIQWFYAYATYRNSQWVDFCSTDNI